MKRGCAQFKPLQPCCSISLQSPNANLPELFSMVFAPTNRGTYHKLPGSGQLAIQMPPSSLAGGKPACHQTRDPGPGYHNMTSSSYCLAPQASFLISSSSIFQVPAPADSITRAWCIREKPSRSPVCRAFH